MAKAIDYDSRWQIALNNASGGKIDSLDAMQPNMLVDVMHVAFQDYLVECYCDHVRQEFGPALAPGENIGVLQLKAALVNRWHISDLPSANKSKIIAALTGELSTFKLPEEAYEVVAFLEKGLPPLAYRGQHHMDFIIEMVKHHRPDHLADQ
ncbi:hypothetical protein [Vreelandella janggokensis]|uniref:hypothetical protein n=1 Tax=Vreelandella janggokensis TaxID=370767 RepID=UPI002864549A|nr:hypothetical protein [Halomonas janggokensis]MDR5887539.1 hypothetical protein [Halomonas janggokensis]